MDRSLKRPLKKSISFITSCAVALSISATMAQTAFAAPAFTSSTILKNDYDMHVTMADSSLFIKGVTVKKANPDVGRYETEKRIKKNAEIIMVDKNGKTTKIKNTIGFDRIYGYGSGIQTDSVATISPEFPHFIVGVGDKVALLLTDGTFYSKGKSYDQITYDENFYYFRTGNVVDVYSTDLKKFISLTYGAPRSIYPHSYSVGDYYYLSLTGKIHEKSGKENSTLSKLNSVSYSEGFYFGYSAKDGRFYILSPKPRVPGGFDVNGSIKTTGTIDWYSYVDKKTNANSVYFAVTDYSAQKPTTKYYTVRGTRFTPEKTTAISTGITATYKIYNNSEVYTGTFALNEMHSSTMGIQTFDEVIFKNSKGKPFAALDGVTGSFYTKDHLVAYGIDGLIIINLKTEKIKELLGGCFYNNGDISYDENKFVLQTARLVENENGISIRPTGRYRLFDATGDALTPSYASIQMNGTTAATTYTAVDSNDDVNILDKDGKVITAFDSTGILFNLDDITAIKLNSKAAIINATSGRLICKNMYLKHLTNTSESLLVDTINNYKYSNGSYGVVTSNASGTKFGLVYIKPIN